MEKLLIIVMVLNGFNFIFLILKASWCKLFVLLMCVNKYFLYPFPKQQILDFSKLKEFADDNFKFNENDRQFSKWVENNVGKGEIAHYKQFLRFPQCFQKTCTADT